MAIVLLSHFFGYIYIHKAIRNVFYLFSISFFNSSSFFVSSNFLARFSASSQLTLALLKRSIVTGLIPYNF